MAGPENTFIASVHRHLPEGLYKMKNHNQYNGGIPDVWYSGPKADLWIEYKFVSLPKRSDTVITPGLSALQTEWLSARRSEGRNVGVIIGSKEGGVWLTGGTWQTPFTAEWFVKNRINRAALAYVITSQTT